MGKGDQEFLAIEQLARRFAAELAATSLRDDAYPFAPWNTHNWQLAAELGLAGIALPESCGGSDQGTLAFARMLQVVAATDASTATVLFTQALARATLLALCAAESPQPYAMLSGQASDPLLAYALYDDPDEPSSTLVARRAGDNYVLDGEAAQLACLPVARACLVTATLDEPGAQRLVFLIETAAAGVQVSEAVVTLGLRACPMADLMVRELRVPAAACLGGADAARLYARAAERFRPALVALSLGVLRGSFDLAYAYARERRQGKKQIVEHHMVQEMLSDMLCVLDTGELALPAACSAADGSSASATELVALQELVTAACARATTDGVQLLGGNGYMHDYGQEKRMRDAKQLQAVFGSSASRRLSVLERKLRADQE